MPTPKKEIKQIGQENKMENIKKTLDNLENNNNNNGQPINEEKILSRMDCLDYQRPLRHRYVHPFKPMAHSHHVHHLSHRKHIRLPTLEKRI